MAKKLKKPKKLSPGEELFALHCRIYQLNPEREVKLIEGRQWRFDFWFPAQKIAVEIEGGTKFGRSRHSQGAGFEGDCRKYNAAVIAGITLIRFTTAMVESAEAIDFIRILIAQASV